MVVAAAVAEDYQRGCIGKRLLFRSMLKKFQRRRRIEVNQHVMNHFLVDLEVLVADHRIAKDQDARGQSAEIFERLGPDHQVMKRGVFSVKSA